MKVGLNAALFIASILIPATLSPQTVSRDETERAMKRASSFFRSISFHGGYAGIYSLDLKERFGEAEYDPAAPSEIWVQPPGTPTVGGTYLRAWRATGDGFYLDAAMDAALALAWGQQASGGWQYRPDLAHYKPLPALPENLPGPGVFDDDTTPGVIAFLMELDREADEPWLTRSVMKGLGFVLESQFENGAWSQWFPLRGGYYDCYTFNDNVINTCINLLLAAHGQYGDDRYLAGAMKGGDFILLSRVSAEQPGWAQQYSHDMKPAWARAFEPPAVCSAVTARNINTLIDLHLYSGEEIFLKPIPAALEWLEKSAIGVNLWARMYEVGTNRPIYGDRDNKIHYTLGEISEERRNGYSWQDSYRIPETRARYEELLRIGRSALGTKESRAEKTPPSPGEIRKIISALDDEGRWVEDGRITCESFVSRMNVLLDYISAL